MINKLRYTLIHRLNRDNVQPLGEGELSIDWQENDEDYFENYEKSLGGNLIIKGDAYQTLLTYENTIYRCEPLTMIIERKCLDNNNFAIWKEIYRGDFSLNDAVWNLEDCYVELSFLNEDPAQCLEENKAEEINLFTIAPERKIVNIIQGDAEYEFNNAYGSWNIPINGPLDIGEYWDEAVTGISIETAKTQGWRSYSHWFRYDFNEDNQMYLLRRETKWIRQKTVISCDSEITDPSLILIENKCHIDNTKVYAKAVTLFNYRSTQDFGNEPNQYLEESYSYSYYGSEQNSLEMEFKNGMLLNDIIVRLIQRFCPSLEVISDFFQINPENQSLINYVTDSRTYTDALMLFQKSDVKRPTAYNVATKAVWTFDKLMEHLYLLFNVKYEIYDNVFRLEHYSFFQRELGLDLTIINNGDYLKGSRKYSYKTEDIPNKEKWQFKEAGSSSSDYFNGSPIIYNSKCVKRNKEIEKTNTIEDIVTDVELVISNSDPKSNVVKDDGFVLMATRNNGGNYSLVTIEPINGGMSKLNNALAIPNLHQDFWKHGRYLDSGIMNGEEQTFYLTKPTKYGEPIIIPFDCDLNFDPRKTIKTYLGDGVVSKASYNILRSQLTLDLMYPVDSNLVSNDPPVANNDTIVLYENQSVLIDVLANDYDEKDIITSIVISQQGAKGIAVVENNKIRYTANVGQLGNDTVKYYITDEWNQQSNIANIGILIRVENESPVAQNDSYTMNMGGVLNISAGNGIFRNDTDDFGFTLDTYDSTSANGYPVIVNSDGSFTYSPNVAFYGFDSFTYTIKDDQNLTSSATVFIEVINPDMPRTNPDTYQTRGGQVLNANGSNPSLIKLLFNDINSSSLNCIAENKSTSKGGNVSIATDGSFTYTPPAGFIGVDTFTYTATNSYGSNIENVTINVLPQIYVSLVLRNQESQNIDITCNNNMQYGGVIEEVDYYVKFWSNPEKTIPFDVTGLGLRIVFTENSTMDNQTSSYDTISLSTYGTEFFIGHKNLLFRQLNCDGIIIMETQQNITLKQTNGYTI